MDVNALVIFYSRYGKTEALALAAGVGAIQARANIRLRRLPDLTSMETIQADKVWRETLERYKKDYIAPREIDAQWADVVILAAPEDRATQMEQYLDSVRDSIKGKIAAVIGNFSNAASDSGLIVVPPANDIADRDSATAYGRGVTENARSAKAAKA